MGYKFRLAAAMTILRTTTSTPSGPARRPVFSHGPVLPHGAGFSHGPGFALRARTAGWLEATTQKLVAQVTGVLSVALVATLAAAPAGAQQTETEPAAPQQSNAADESLDSTWRQVLGTQVTAEERTAEDARRDGTERIEHVPPVQLDHRGADWRYDVSVSGTQYARTGFDAAAGDVERRTYTLGVDATVGGRDGFWSLGYEFENHVYRFAGATGLLPGTSSPVESLGVHRFGVTRRARMSERWTGTFAAGIDLALESGADIGDAATWRLAALLGYEVHEDLSIEFGLFARDRLEDDVLAIPVIGVNWRIDEGTRLAFDGRGLTLSHAYEDGARVFARAAYENRQFRLDDTGPNPNGSFADSAFTAIVGMNFDAGIAVESLATSRIEIYGGAVLGRELEFRANGVRVGGADADPGAVFGLRLELGL